MRTIGPDVRIPPNICTVAGPTANKASFDHAHARLSRTGWLVFPANAPPPAAGTTETSFDRSTRRIVRRKMIDISTLLYVCDIPSPAISDPPRPFIDEDTVAEIRHAVKRGTSVNYMSNWTWPARAPYDWYEVEGAVVHGKPSHGDALMLREWRDLEYNAGRCAA